MGEGNAVCEEQRVLHAEQVTQETLEALVPAYTPRRRLLRDSAATIRPPDPSEECYLTQIISRSSRAIPLPSNYVADQGIIALSFRSQRDLSFGF